MFSESKSRAKRLYREFMREPEDLKPDEVYAVKDQRLKGSDAFVERVLAERIEDNSSKRKRVSLDDIADAVERTEGIDKATLRSGTRVRTVTRARNVVSFVARSMGHTVKDIAAYLSIDGASISGYEPERLSMAGHVAKIKRQLDKT